MTRPSWPSNIANTTPHKIDWTHRWSTLVINRTIPNMIKLDLQNTKTSHIRAMELLHPWTSIPQIIILIQVKGLSRWTYCLCSSILNLFHYYLFHFSKPREYYLYRKEKKEMWMGKEVISEVLYYEVQNKIRDHKPKTYFIFKDLLKRCTTTTTTTRTQVLHSLSPSHTDTYTCMHEINKNVDHQPRYCPRHMYIFEQ